MRKDPFQRDTRTEVTSKGEEVLAKIGVVYDFGKALIGLIDAMEKVLSGKDERKLLLDCTVDQLTVRPCDN